jgi:hypothetical protein
MAGAAGAGAGVAGLAGGLAGGCWAAKGDTRAAPSAKSAAKRPKVLNIFIILFLVLADSSDQSKHPILRIKVSAESILSK